MLPRTAMLFDIIKLVIASIAALGALKIIDVDAHLVTSLIALYGGTSATRGIIRNRGSSE